VSKNLVELIRRHHEQDAPTALAVLKAAVEDHGTITDDDRRVAAERSGLPEATVYGVSTFYDDLLHPRGERHVRVCTGTACFAATADAHVDQLRAGFGLELGQRAPDGAVSLAETVCLGFCHSAPAFRDGDVIDAGPGAAERVLAGRCTGAPEPEPVSILAEPVLLRQGDWSGLRAALASTPEALLEAVKDADVRGRGGAGFPAGTKWEFTRANALKAGQAFIVANGDEGDPGSYIDKWLMEANPALLLEGMALAGYAVGAGHGFVLTRSEYPRSKPALEAAVEVARASAAAASSAGLERGYSLRVSTNP
jgi:NADH:ubiquinone oxidoreductase subunit E